MTLPHIVIIDAHEYARGAVTEAKVPVSAEYPVTLKLNGNPYVVLACSGSDLEHLALGHLLTDGIITSAREVRDIRFDAETLSVNITTETGDELLERLFRVRSIASGCGQESAVIAGTLPSRNPSIPELRAETVIACMKEFLRMSEVYGLTHGVHSAALFRISGERMVFFEEIGRHNAVDKVLGYAAAEETALGDTMLLSTGRLSSEIVQKAASGPVPIIISRAAPTARSVEMARAVNIMMIGRVRGGSFHIFHGADRVLC